VTEDVLFPEMSKKDPAEPVVSDGGMSASAVPQLDGLGPMANVSVPPASRSAWVR
jgi:hypothetical protein